MTRFLGELQAPQSLSGNAALTRRAERTLSPPQLSTAISSHLLIAGENGTITAKTEFKKNYNEWMNFTANEFSAGSDPWCSLVLVCLLYFKVTPLRCNLGISVTGQC